MNERLQETVRLDAEQRDRVLDLAARLQARHEGTIAVDDLAQAAREAGIDPRFVHEAARMVTHAPSMPQVAPSADRTVAISLVATLALLNAVVAVTSLGSVTTTVGGVWFLILAAVAGYWSGKARLPLWLVATTVLGTLLGTHTFVSVVVQTNDSWRGSVILTMLVEAVLAFVAGLFALAVERHRSAQAR